MTFLEFLDSGLQTATPRASTITRLDKCSFQRMVGETGILTIFSGPILGTVAGMETNAPQCPAGALAIVVGFRHEGR